MAPKYESRSVTTAIMRRPSGETMRSATSCGASSGASTVRTRGSARTPASAAVMAALARGSFHTRPSRPRNTMMNDDSRIRELPRDELLRDVRFDALRGARVECPAPPEHERGQGEREAADGQDGPVPPEGQVCEPAVHGALPRRVTVEGVRATDRAHVGDRRAQRQAHRSGAVVLHEVLPASSYLHRMDANRILGDRFSAFRPSTES
jgi:hypothetical protein